jgi:hypothetical protein
LDLIHLDPFICVSFSGIFQFLQKITLSAAILGVIGYMEGCGLQHGRLWIAAWKVVDCSMEGCGLQHGRLWIALDWYIHLCCPGIS